MLDFTSALYLGMRHPSNTVGPWPALTTGRPAAIEEPPGATPTAQSFAALVGCEAGLLYPSTLHLFCDLFHSLARRGSAILIDEQVYPIVRWAAEKASAREAEIASFPHHDGAALERAARRLARRGLRTIVVTDALCPSCGCLAPLSAYARAVRAHNGLLVVDDTQGLGILGRAPSPAAPLGLGGGGSLPYHGLCGDPAIIVGASLAKAFGAPVAALLGPRTFIRTIAAEGPSRLHASPPDAATIQAAYRAFAMNAEQGDALRNRLVCLVMRLRSCLERVGLGAAAPLPLPIVSLPMKTASGAASLARRLLAFGLRAIAVRSCRSPHAALTMLLTARHTLRDVRRASRLFETALHAGADFMPSLRA